MKHVTFHSFDSPALLANQLAMDVAYVLEAAKQPSLVVSGGSTPAPFFEALLRQDIMWDRVHMTLADERWVDTDSDASNEKLIARYFFGTKVHFTPLKNDAPTPEAGLPETTAGLIRIPRPFDVVILGMGEDGHTASLFPGCADEALDPDNDALCVAVHPEDKEPRMSLTASCLLNTQKLIVHITGEKKREVLEKGEGLPIHVFLEQDIVPVEVYWSR